MKTYRSLKNQDLTKTDTKTLEQARDELTQDISQDRIHTIEKHDMFALASHIVQELEKRKGGREAYQKERQRSMPQPEGDPTHSPQQPHRHSQQRKKTGLSFSTILLGITIVLLILVVVFLV